jgi:hypothetical protein
MIAVSEAAVAIVTSIIVTGVIVLLAVLFTMLLRRTRRVLSPIAGTTWLTAIGSVIVIAGVVDLIWTQVDTPVVGFGIRRSAHFRWDEATSGTIVISLGLLVCIASQMLHVMQVRAAHDADERSVGTRV